MTPRPIPRSRRSSRNWPPLTIELRGSPRLALAWVAWCLALATGLWLGCALPGWARAGLGLLALALAWRGGWFLLGRGFRGPRTGSRLRWEADGRWWYENAAQQGAYVQCDRPRRLGPVVWLRWRGPQGPLRCCLDGAGMEPKAWVRLKARMKLSAPAGHGS